MIALKACKGGVIPCAKLCPTPRAPSFNHPKQFREILAVDGNAFSRYVHGSLLFLSLRRSKPVKWMKSRRRFLQLLSGIGKGHSCIAVAVAQCTNTNASDVKETVHVHYSILEWELEADSGDGEA